MRERLNSVVEPQSQRLPVHGRKNTADAASVIKLSEVLLSADRLPEHWELFLPSDRRWFEDIVGTLFGPDSNDDPDDPEYARVHGLIAALGVPQIQEVVSNAPGNRPRRRAWRGCSKRSCSSSSVMRSLPSAKAEPGAF